MCKPLYAPRDRVHAHMHVLCGPPYCICISRVGQNTTYANPYAPCDRPQVQGRAGGCPARAALVPRAGCGSILPLALPRGDRRVHGHADDGAEGAAHARVRRRARVRGAGGRGRLQLLVPRRRVRGHRRRAAACACVAMCIRVCRLVHIRMRVCVCGMRSRVRSCPYPHARACVDMHSPARAYVYPIARAAQAVLGGTLSLGPGGARVDLNLTMNGQESSPAGHVTVFEDSFEPLASGGYARACAHGFPVWAAACVHHVIECIRIWLSRVGHAFDMCISRMQLRAGARPRGWGHGRARRGSRIIRFVRVQRRGAVLGPRHQPRGVRARCAYAFPVCVAAHCKPACRYVPCAVLSGGGAVACTTPRFVVATASGSLSLDGVSFPAAGPRAFAFRFYPPPILRGVCLEATCARYARIWLSSRAPLCVT